MNLIGGVGHKLEQVTNQKRLGVQTDHFLTWNEHVTKVKNTVLLKGQILTKLCAALKYAIQISDRKDVPCSVCSSGRKELF